jgi:hypothetical protein
MLIMKAIPEKPGNVVLAIKEGFDDIFYDLHFIA